MCWGEVRWSGKMLLKPRGSVRNIMPEKERIMRKMEGEIE